MLNVTVGAIFALVVGFGFIIFVHELGHFLVAKWVGIKCTQFAIGFGPSIFAWRKGIGLRAGSTEPEYARLIEEHLKKSLSPDDPDGSDDTGDPSDQPDPVEQQEEQKEQAKYSTQLIDSATAELGLGETEYRLNYLPLGGYVKMMGQEDLDPSARSDDPRAFNSKPVWARACVISAGVIMNLIFGLIFFVIAFMAGVRFPPPIAGGIIPDSPASTTYAQDHAGDPDYRGLAVGDRITHIDAKPIRDMMDVRAATMLSKKETELRFTVQRQRTNETLEFVLTPKPDERQENLLTVGIAPPLTTEVKGVVPHSDAQAAGVTQDMQVKSVDDQPVEDYADFHRLITEKRGQPAEVRFADTEGNSAVVTLAAEPRLTRSEGIYHLIGFVPPTQVSDFVNDDSPLKQAGAMTGDLIASLDGQPWPTAAQVIDLVERDNPIEVEVYRQGQLLSLGKVTPTRGKFNIRIGYYLDEAIVRDSVPGSPAATLNLTAGSRIVKVQDRPVKSWADLQRELGAVAAVANDQPVDVKIAYELNIAGNPPDTTTVRLQPDQVARLAAAGWTQPMSVVFVDMLQPVVVANPFVAIGLGFEKTWQIVVQTYISLVRVVDGTVEFKQIRGPVGIVHIGTKVAKQGFTYFLFFLGLISISLAVINFLPIPIVDGGLMVFLLIEKIKGSPASPAVQIAAMWIGLALIGGVFLLVTYNDIARLVTG